jgi:DNA-directed RNA polymerase specialized sigma24 family protein
VVEVIGAALLAKASGLGHRRIAAALGVPATTVRRWLRRFSRRAAELWALGTQIAH